jgi:hypothetical protein
VPHSPAPLFSKIIIIAFSEFSRLFNTKSRLNITDENFNRNVVKKRKNQCKNKNIFLFIGLKNNRKTAFPKPCLPGTVL